MNPWALPTCLGRLWWVIDKQNEGKTARKDGQLNTEKRSIALRTATVWVWGWSAAIYFKGTSVARISKNVQT